MADSNSTRELHGMSGSRTYESWGQMFKRCGNPKHSSHVRYGGRGISVCARWKSFTAFLEDMGERPEGTSLERIDNNGNYEPGNCRWATKKEQQRNMRSNRLLTHNGRTMCIAEWAETAGISALTLHSRLNIGWTIDEALSIPVGRKRDQQQYDHRHHLVTFNGKTLCTAEWAKLYGLLGTTLRQRLKLGWDIERALTTPARSHVRSPSTA